MIIKLIKIINNKFIRIFKFIFFLRYLLSIFIVAFVSFLSIPHFFDYKKKEKIIKTYLLDNYGFEVKKIGKISFNSFPTPNLEINNLIIYYGSEDINFNIGELIIYPKMSGIYDFQKFRSKKIGIHNGNFNVSLNKIKSLDKLLKFRKRISLENVDINILDNYEDIITFKKINYHNYGYKKNIINGMLFNKNFKINIKNDYTKVDFKLLETGISASLNVLKNEKDSPLTASFEGQVLQSKFKLNFTYNGNLLVNDFFFRAKQLAFDSKGNIKLNPYFFFNLTHHIKKFDSKLLNLIYIEHLLKFKNVIQKINSQNTIFFESKRLTTNLIDSLEIKTKMAYGRANIYKKFIIAKSKFLCESDLNLLEDYPIIYFECSVYSPNKKNLLKKIGIKNKDNSPLTLKVIGNLNILNNKINFKAITMNDNYEAKTEDLKYYKLIFQEILFNDDFIKIFNLSKVKEFINEIS